jgi:hypothetical protein
MYRPVLSTEGLDPPSQVVIRQLAARAHPPPGGFCLGPHGRIRWYICPLGTDPGVELPSVVSYTTRTQRNLDQETVTMHNINFSTVWG